MMVKMRLLSSYLLSIIKTFYVLFTSVLMQVVNEMNFNEFSSMNLHAIAGYNITDLENNLPKSTLLR